MTDLRVVTTNGTDAILDQSTLQDFAASLRGRVLQPEDNGYDDARKVWNGMIDRRPALIAKCAGAADVIAAVRFAREQNLIFSIKGGGHNVTGNAVCEGGLVIDPSGMRSTRVDPVSLTVRAAAGGARGEARPGQ